MADARIGIDIGDLKAPAKRALSLASELRFRNVELPAGVGDLTPEQLSDSGRRHLRRYLEGLGLSASALTGDMPGLSFAASSSMDERIARTIRVLDLARDLGVACVTSAGGAVADAKSGEPLAGAVEALRSIGEAADVRGVRFALRPTHDGGEGVTRVLERVACPSLSVCLDPGAMVMRGQNPLERIEHFAEKISLFHARDAAAGSVDPGSGEVHLGHEAAIGEGDVDFVGLLATLSAADYGGALILRRTQSVSPAEDLSYSRDRLQQLLPP